MNKYIFFILLNIYYFGNTTERLPLNEEMICIVKYKPILVLIKFLFCFKFSLLYMQHVKTMFFCGHEKYGCPLDSGYLKMRYCTNKGFPTNVIFIPKWIALTEEQIMRHTAGIYKTSSRTHMPCDFKHNNKAYRF